MTPRPKSPEDARERLARDHDIKISNDRLTKLWSFMNNSRPPPLVIDRKNMMRVNSLQIRDSVKSDLEDVLLVERAAFGQEDEAALVKRLLDDPSAEPILSLLALMDNKPVGHILFTRATLRGHETDLNASILAPLAVIPEAQNQGIGGKLIQEGLQRLASSGIDLVFVLGYPEYYTRHGFQPAIPQGLFAPYPIPDEVSDAWMVQALRPGLPGTTSGQLMCCDALDSPEYWIE